MTNSDIFNLHEDLLGDINRFHNKFGFKKNEKVGIPDDPELVNFRTSFLMEELAEYVARIVKESITNKEKQVEQHVTVDYRKQPEQERLI